ncbi:alpha/beta hydrolase [Nocardiopsis sp. HNM0947]|uniref:Alpha/beta hydrolase n=1 Tax=Nocardiopsis coralli TaxID=2772213 RepID=A0ABR9P2L1_9ACTN|nr:alpha/beta hydrolase [Nocardiopsis coralli]MBE2998066.1 alpha/beta hydrolase [Nocardiopsis coralli]
MRRLLAWTAGVLAVLLALGAVAFVVWAGNPYEAAPGSLERAERSADVAVDEDGVVITPRDGGVDTAVVFYPGARVEPEAYAASWAPVVAETGVSVVMPRMPFNLAVLAPGRAEAAMERIDADTWYLGGHSMGGAMAAFAAEGDALADRTEGLVLWGSYVAGTDLAGREDLRVLSVTASEDLLADPDTVRERSGNLPEDTVSVEIDGMNHAQFGDYGPQTADGTPRIGDDEAHAELADTTAGFLGNG